MLRDCIIVNSFGRGGSNFVMNILGSSHVVRLPAEEFWQLYYAPGWNLAPKIHRRWGTAAGGLAAAAQFSRPRFLKRLEHSIARADAADLQLRKVRSLPTPSRLALKVTEHDIFQNERIAACFDTASFVGLTRNGYGLCESWGRRGTPAHVAGKVYAQIAGRMLEERARHANYKIFQFEDLLADPQKVIVSLYAHLKLAVPPDDLYMHRSKGYGPGEEGSSAEKRVTSLLTGAEWRYVLAGGVNNEAMHRLSPAQIRSFNSQAAPVMEALGYPLQS